MIIKFNLFESNKMDFEVGDYVIVDTSDITDPYLSEQLRNQIGQIIYINDLEFPITVKYDQYERLAGINTNTFNVTYDEVLYHSKSKYELEIHLMSKKYNL